MTGVHVSEHATLQIANYTSLDDRVRRTEFYAELLGVQSVKKGGLDFVFYIVYVLQFHVFWNMEGQGSLSYLLDGQN